MQKSLALIILAASSLMLEGGGAISLAAEEANLAAEEANSNAVVAPKTTPPQSSQPSQRKMHRMQKPGGKAHQSNSAQGQPEGAPSPSQRSMRQKLKEAKSNQAPATGNPESR